MDDVHYLTAEQLGVLFDRQELSPTEVTKALLGRIEEVDSSIRCYATVLEESALREAALAEAELGAGNRRGPLHGVPVAVKDLCDVAAAPTMVGTPVLRDNTAASDSTVVGRLRAGGAVILGKLNMTEGAMVGYHPDFDVPVNPWGPNRWAGASSSGSGAATAAGMCVAALGSDTGGSIRFPAAANGVVGIKPTYGLVSRHGVFPLAESLDHVGPFARSVWDAAAVLETIAGEDRADPTSLPGQAPSLIAGIGAGVEGLRIGVDRNYISDGAEPATVDAVLAAVDVLVGQGAEVVQIEVPPCEDQVWTVLCSAEAAAAHARFYPDRADEYGSFFAQFLAMGSQQTGAAVVDALHRRAEFAGALRSVFQRCDAIACPAMPSAAPIAPPEELRGSIEEVFTTLAAVSICFTGRFDLSGSPTITVPSGFDGDGLPLAVQLVGRHGGEELLGRLAHAYQASTDWHHRHPQ